MAKPNWMTQDEVCGVLKVSRPTLQRYRRNGTGPAFYRIPAGIRYLQSDVDMWLAARRHAA